MLSKAQHGPDRKEAGEHSWQPQRPEIAPEEGLRKEDRVKVQRSVVVHRIVTKVTVACHLICKPAIHTLVEMRWLDVEQSDTQRRGECQDADLNPGKCFQ